MHGQPHISYFMLDVVQRKRGAKLRILGEYLGLRTDLWNLVRFYVEEWLSMSGPSCDLYKTLT